MSLEDPAPRDGPRRTVQPAHVDAEKITAYLSEGVLTVRVPKSAAAKPRRIAIGAH